MNYERGFLRLYAITMLGSLVFELWDSGGAGMWFQNWLPFGASVTALYLCTRWAVKGFKQ